ncbi:hypothetical protein GCM10009846_03940 [Agrococcus versicolor]|uniref:CHAT domain-containing protein n=1 Tax=Agrococcus versicolor TaxID=501482 RepID=A0ABN3AJV0_9MICO
MKPEREVSFPAPLYVVAVPLGPEPAQAYTPIVAQPQGGTFDEDVTPALIGVAYALHLPKNRFETLDLPLQGVQDQARSDHRSHSIALIPDSLLADLDLIEQLVARFDPVVILAAEAQLEAARSVAAHVGFRLAPASFDSLDQESLDEHWAELASQWSGDWPAGVTVDSTAIQWTWPLAEDGSVLSLRRLARLMGFPRGTIDDAESPFQSAAGVRHLRVRLDALVELEGEGATPLAAEQKLPQVIQEQMNATRTRLTVSMSGTSGTYERLATISEGSARGTFNDDYPDVRSLLVSHASAGDHSMGLVLEGVLDRAMFQAIADLERHWAEGPKPAAVKRLIDRIDKAAAKIWTGEFVAAIKNASHIDAFTNFPLGLLTLPGDSSPLSNRLPISYRSINPLTRALQLELSPPSLHRIQPGFRILVVECIPRSDRIGIASRAAWAAIATEMAAAGVRFDIREVASPDAFRKTVAQESPDILIISAHGFHDSKSNVAGIVIGESARSLGLDLGPMPPMVILSACHTSPRGGGVVSIGDLLLRAGAEAVLSTLVPVNVEHNAQTVGRFLRYLAIAADEPANAPSASILDIWHQVQGLNVINDMTTGASQLRKWILDKTAGDSALEEFMRGPHGMRRAHLFADAEARLVQIAERRGDGERVRGWLRAPGYLPESLMYLFLGRPSSIRVGVVTP